MSKRKDKELEDILSGLAGLVFLGFMGLWFTDRGKFYLYFSIILLVLVVALVIIVKIKKRRFDNVYSWHSGKSLIKQLQAMHPTEFEEYIADLYIRLGYKAEAVGKSHDGGIDVVISKDGLKHFVQCKKFITSKVGVGDMRDFYGAMAGKLADSKGLFITTNIFTTEAEKFAEDKPVELIDGDKLLKLIKLAKKNNDEIIIKNSECPECGGDLVEKKGKYGKFLGCSYYPKCWFTSNN
jgi:restriction system protein